MVATRFFANLAVTVAAIAIARLDAVAYAGDDAAFTPSVPVAEAIGSGSGAASDAQKEHHKVRCDALVTDCYAKARKECGGEYKVIEMNEREHKRAGRKDSPVKLTHRRGITLSAPSGESKPTESGGGDRRELTFVCAAAPVAAPAAAPTKSPASPTEKK